VEMGSSYNRSVNASCACETLAKLGRGVGNVFSDVAGVWYLQGYYDSKSVKNEFMVTAAHESGHPVLASYAYKSTGLSNYSWVHKGSSKGIEDGFDTPKDGEKGYEKFNQGEDADLMKYYQYYIEPMKFHSAEYDIKSLIWLSNIYLGE